MGSPVRIAKRVIAAIPGTVWLKRKFIDRGRGKNPVPVSLPLARGAAPIADRAALLASYSASPLAKEPDTFVLYRIIGNDLPPRHSKGQGRENLASYSSMSRRWRIARNGSW